MSDDAHLSYDPSKPNVARAYDYLLGGKDNFAPDRELVARLLELDPGLIQGANENRQFLIRAVEWVARRGINQFIDVGSGLPTMMNTDEAARAVQPAARVVYVDKDPVAVSHGRALLSSECVDAIPGDLCEPDAILADPALTKLIDLGEPACLILCAVLHFVDAATARAVTGEFIRALAPGSYVIISVARADGEVASRYMQSYSAGRLHNHSPEQVAGFFAGTELVPPGVVEASTWPVRGAMPTNHATVGQLLAGVGRKPSRT